MPTPEELNRAAEERARHSLEQCLSGAKLTYTGSVYDIVNSSLIKKAESHILNLDAKVKELARDDGKMTRELGIAEAEVKKLEKERNELKVKTDMAMAALKGMKE